jgi:hypothetical protein
MLRPSSTISTRAALVLVTVPHASRAWAGIRVVSLGPFVRPGRDHAPSVCRRESITATNSDSARGGQGQRNTALTAASESGEPSRAASNRRFR